jgi:DNA-binding Lrp family transcriptional regulator
MSTPKKNRHRRPFFDEVDIQIVNFLHKNKWANNKEVAGAVGLAESATLKRILKLKESGLLTAEKGFFDLAKIGYLHKVTLQVSCKPTSVDHVLHSLQSERTITLVEELKPLDPAKDMVIRAEMYSRDLSDCVRKLEKLFPYRKRSQLINHLEVYSVSEVLKNNLDFFELDESDVLEFGPD